jgi:hypothetical protein
MMMLMLHTTWINTRWKHPDFSHFRKAVAYHAGFTERLKLLDGNYVTQVRSMQYMTEDEFRVVYPAMRAICERILHDLALYDVEDRIHGMAA